MALSQKKKDILKSLSPIVGDILKVDANQFVKYETLSMPMKRGQGKRSGGMIKGGMGSWYGSEKRMVIDYSCFIKDMRKEEISILRVQYSGRMHLYVMARAYGLDHYKSFCFAMFFSLGMFKKK